MDSPKPIPYAWRAQPDGISCGPTCIAMLRDGLALRHGVPGAVPIPGIGAMCGTNTRTGTTHEGVAVALAGLGVSARRSLGPEGFRRGMAGALEAGDPVLLRTLSRGCKHWILAANAEPRGRVRLLDPGVGTVTVPLAQVEALVAPRGHEIWVADARVAPLALDLGPLLPGGADAAARAEAIALCRPAFAHLIDDDIGAYLDRNVDWSASRALRVGGRLVGAYLLNPRRLSDEFPELAGSGHDRAGAVEGVALVVDPDARGRGYGRLLRDQPRALGYRQVWGYQDKRLGNLDRWLARRDLVHDAGDSWITAETLPAPGHRAVAEPGAAWGP